MHLRPDWRDAYVEDDQFRHPWKKSDVIYLLVKFTRNKDGGIPSFGQLRRLNRRQLRLIWAALKPLDFGLPPEEVRHAQALPT